MDKSRTTVLLGAGASFEADIPMSHGLTRAIVEAIDRPRARHMGAVQALHIAIGAMIAYDTARGANAYAGIEVERLFSAIQMLGQRDSVELSPFVAAWTPGLDAVGRVRGLPAFFQSDFERDLLGGFSSRFDNTFRKGVEAVVGRSSSESIFVELEEQMLRALRSALEVEPEKVDYLAPLLNLGPAPVQIATLNYDRSIECLAERAGASMDTGVETWAGGLTWDWGADVDLRLLKLHGSLDWWYVQGDRDPLRLEDDLIEVRSIKSGEHLVNARPALVFGQRGKLRSDGPFLAMLQGLDEFLRLSRRVVVVGYSFRDEHINATIRRWYNNTPEPEVVLIDPALREAPHLDNASPFLKSLINVMYPWNETPGRRELGRGHVVLAEGAGSALEQLLGKGPTLRAPSASSPQQ